MARPVLAELLRRPDIWRGNDFAESNRAGVPTGHARLDAELPGGGWPRGDLTELLGKTNGVGELSLLMPALLSISQAGGWIALVAPPWRLNAPAWAARGLSLERLLLIEAGQGPHVGREMAWCCEELLRGGHFSAVLAWLEGAGPVGLPAPWLRRLQVSASATQSLMFLWRSESMASAPSPAPLRIAWRPSSKGLELQVFKRRGGPASGKLILEASIPSRIRNREHVVAGPLLSSTGAGCHPAWA